MFEDRMGFNQAALVDEPLVAKGIELWLERVFGFYGEDGGVDVEIISGMLILNDRTRDHIYKGDFTAREIRYTAGSRPMLERVLAEVVTPGMSEREKALAILRRCRDNRDYGLKGGDWHGGSEEELLKRGAIMCNEISRVFVCLCQMAGMRARVMCSHISGHMMAEVEVDGSWWWMDPRHGTYVFNDDGSYASTWDLMKRPTLFERQAKALAADLRPVGPFEYDAAEADAANKAFLLAKSRDCYFHPKEAVAIGNYYVWEMQKYTFPWRREPANPARLFRARLAEMKNRQALSWPAYYMNPYLFDAPA